MADDALPTPEPRKKATKKRIGEMLKRQRGLCALCPTVLAKINQNMVFICAPFDVDHTQALDHLGTNEDENLRCLCKPCHSAKTKLDVKASAKGRRVRTDQERHAARMRMKATMTPAAIRREKLKEKIAAGNRAIRSRNTFDTPSPLFAVRRSESPDGAGVPKRSWPKGRKFMGSSRFKKGQA